MDLYNSDDMSEEHADLGNEVVLRCLMTVNHDGSDKRLLASDNFFRLSATCRQIDANLRSISVIDNKWETSECAYYARQFRAVREVCVLAGYAPDSMPYFFRINDFLEENINTEVHFKTDFAIGPLDDIVSNDRVADLRNGMYDITIGRSAVNQFVCENDMSVSRVHGVIRQHGRKFWFSNLSTNIDCWVLKQGGDHFVMIGKHMNGRLVQRTELELGDVVILSTSNLSMFTVELNMEHVNRLIQLVQPAHELLNKSRNPKSHAEAIDTLKLSRVQRILDVCIRFDEMVKTHAIQHGPHAVDKFQKNVLLHGPHIAAKHQKLLQTHVNLSSDLVWSQWKTYVLSEINPILCDQCHSAVDREKIVSDFMQLLAQIAVKDKTDVARQFKMYQTMLVFEGDLSTAPCAKVHYSKGPGYQPLTRIENHVGNRTRMRDGDCDSIMHDKRPTRATKWLCAVSKRIWIRSEERDFKNHVLWQREIRAHGV